ncbi:Protein mab-21-like 3 [Amphibalanus amphitrite]|uniref:Protein mab-21-like 3 n=1 Tax=Amphibalanus amphitrite TaxID=1232801 RepID=A0A6A4WXY1_AMPAM|nr:uncharacterized protein LOC122384245 isoform X1 [Amphibalanus amphitrite]XP_043227357.1 uncharacterized protein LOC122384245 isoform X1 [Amphibalanus amphitrite]KAF0311755.1 Protein mab-21-like 3 [Amphibalanus amphitrite]
MASGWQRLHALHEEASEWLAVHAPVSTTALFHCFSRLLKHRVSTHYDVAVPINEAMIEASLCMSQSRAGMPLPLPDSRADCPCAHLTGLTVDRAFLSGSARENCNVTLLDSCASDVDVMLQLGGIRVEERQETVRAARVPCRSLRTQGPGVEGSGAMVDSQTGNPADGGQTAAGGSAGIGFGAGRGPGTIHAGGGGNGENVGTESGAVGGSEPERTGAVGSSEPGLAGRVGSSEPGPSGGGLKPGLAGAVGGRNPMTGDGGGPKIVVSMERAEQPGFFLLRHRTLPGCTHRRALPLQARRVVELIDSLRQRVTEQSASYSGPAVSATVQNFAHRPADIDLVACVRCPRWPSADYASRPRPAGWPDAALVVRLCRTAAFLVPVGFPGSAMESLQWRLSFSKHEYIALRNMTADQRMCLLALKFCRAVVGPTAKPLKSYYLKTALLWLAESRAADQWTAETMHDSLLLILRYLDICLARGYLPCYFWPEVNLLASRSDAERAELAAAVAELRRRLLPAVLALLADWLGRPVPELAERLLLRAERLSSGEFWGMTALSALGQTLARPAASEAESGDGDDSDSDDSLMDRVLNVVTFGKNQTAGSLLTFHPFFSGHALTLNVFEQLGNREDLSSFVGLLSLFQRGEGIAKDSWLEEP